MDCRPRTTRRLAATLTRLLLFIIAGGYVYYGILLCYAFSSIAEIDARCNRMLKNYNSARLLLNLMSTYSQLVYSLRLLDYLALIQKNIAMHALVHLDTGEYIAPPQ